MIWSLWDLLKNERPQDLLMIGEVLATISLLPTVNLLVQRNRNAAVIPVEELRTPLLFLLEKIPAVCDRVGLPQSKFLVERCLANLRLDNGIEACVKSGIARWLSEVMFNELSSTVFFRMDQRSSEIYRSCNILSVN